MCFNGDMTTTKRIPNNQCENTSAGRARKGQVIRLKNFAPTWDDQADLPWDEREFTRKSTDYLVLKVETVQSYSGRRFVTSYRLTLVEVANPGDPRTLTLSSSVRILVVPEA